MNCPPAYVYYHLEDATAWLERMRREIMWEYLWSTFTQPIVFAFTCWRCFVIVGSVLMVSREMVVVKIIHYLRHENQMFNFGFARMMCIFRIWAQSRIEHINTWLKDNFPIQICLWTVKLRSSALEKSRNKSVLSPTCHPKWNYSVIMTSVGIP